MALTNWAELEKSVYDATFSIGAESVGDAINVAVQLINRQGRDINFVACILFYLSSDALGKNSIAIPTSLTAGTDGSVFSAIGGRHISAVAGGTVVEPRAAYFISEADGDIDIVITGDTGADTVYLNAVMPTGQVVTSKVISIIAD